jgi:type III pantothenate kinase
VVDAERGHLGGAIGPGVGVSARALAQRAELLRPFELKPPTELIARSTGEGLRSGFVYGFAAMLDGMVRRLRTQVGEPLRVVATGGDAALIVLLCEEAIEVNDALVLEGLRLIATAGV